MTLSFNAVIPIFNRTLWLMMLYYQTKIGCKPASSLEDTTEIVTFGLYKPTLWPWCWKQRTNYSAWHSGLWRCIAIWGLMTKCFVVQKISSRQIFTNILNLCCDLDLEHSNPIFPQNTLAYDVVLASHVWLQSNQQFRKYNKISHILII